VPTIRIADPGEGTKDTSGYQNVTGTVSYATDAGWGAGFGPGAYKFDGGATGAQASMQRNAQGLAVERVHFRFRFNALPAGNVSIYRDASDGVDIRLGSDGKLAITTGVAAGGLTVLVQGATVLAANTTHYFTLIVNVTSTTVYTLTLYLNGHMECSVTNGSTLAAVPASNIAWGWNSTPGAAIAGVNRILWIRDVYNDDGGATPGTPFGDLRGAIKLPNANGTTWPTGYDTATGSPANRANNVNERPPSATLTVSQVATAAATQSFQIEGVAAGDVDCSGWRLVARGSAVHGSGAAAASIIDDGAAVVPGTVFSTTAGLRIVYAETSTYPGGDAVGQRTTAVATDAIINACFTGLFFVVDKSLVPRRPSWRTFTKRRAA
jgi:hypothetical protein